MSYYSHRSSRGHKYYTHYGSFYDGSGSASRINHSGSRFHSRSERRSRSFGRSISRSRSRSFGRSRSRSFRRDYGRPY